jgi:hypothetical protein
VSAAIQSAQRPEIGVTLAGELTGIRFVQVHLDDLRTIISVTGNDAMATVASTRTATNIRSASSRARPKM